MQAYLFVKLTKVYKLEKDYNLDAYDYELPEERIAQYPSSQAEKSRLLIMSRSEKEEIFQDALFENLADFLPDECLLVANNTRVLPARLIGKRKGGGSQEFLLLTPIAFLLKAGAMKNQANAQCLLRPANKVKIGDLLDLAPGLSCKVLQKGEFGRHEIKLFWNGNLEDIFWQYGSLPLPPYIKRQPDNEDSDRYQTCYAKITGSVAAPTAGLHFTEKLKDQIIARGNSWREITLHVGYGTFSPVRENDIRQHKMHSEFVEISEGTANAINLAKKKGRAIIAIGTTSLRALEGMALENGKIEPCRGWTDIYLYPGSKFNIVDGLVTNFHLPRSSLLMLVSAFAGRSRVLSAYSYALSHAYNFFSYGDAMLIK